MSAETRNPYFLSRLTINLVFFLNGFLYVSWAARTPLIQETFSLSFKQLGFVLLSSSLGLVVAMPLTGYLINKYGSRWVMIIAAICFFISLPLFTLSPSYAWMIAAFFFMGASVGAMDVSMNGQAVEIEKRYGRPIMSFFHALFSVGMMAGALSVTVIEKIEISLFVHLFSLSVLAIIIILYFQRHLINDDSVAEAEASDSKTFYFPKGPIVVFGLVAFCCMLGEGAMTEWTANYMINVGGATDYIAPFALFSFSGCMAVGRFLGDNARQNFGDKKLISYGGVLSSIGLIVALIFPYPLVIVLSLGIVGLGLSTVVPIVYSMAGNIPGVKAGVGISAVTTIGYSGFILGPPIIGLLADVFNLRIAWAFILILFVTMTVISLFKIEKV